MFSYPNLTPHSAANQCDFIIIKSMWFYYSYAPKDIHFHNVKEFEL